MMKKIKIKYLYFLLISQSDVGRHTRSIRWFFGFMVIFSILFKPTVAIGMSTVLAFIPLIYTNHFDRDNRFRNTLSNIDTFFVYIPAIVFILILIVIFS